MNPLGRSSQRPPPSPPPSRSNLSILRLHRPICQDCGAKSIAKHRVPPPLAHAATGHLSAPWHRAAPPCDTPQLCFPDLHSLFVSARGCIMSCHFIVNRYQTPFMPRTPVFAASGRTDYNAKLPQRRPRHGTPPTDVMLTSIGTVLDSSMGSRAHVG